MIILSKRDFLKNVIEEENKDSEWSQQLKPKLHFIIHSFIPKIYFFFFLSACFVVNWWCCSVTKTCLTLCNPMDYSMPGFLSFTVSPGLLKLMSMELMMSFNHLILCHPLLLLPSVFPSIRIFSNELAFRIRWRKYCDKYTSSIKNHSGFVGLTDNSKGKKEEKLIADERRDDSGRDSVKFQLNLKRRWKIKKFFALFFVISAKHSLYNFCWRSSYAVSRKDTFLLITLTCWPGRKDRLVEASFGLVHECKPR